MTMPHLMNCEHSQDGWCLECVKAMHESTEQGFAVFVRIKDEHVEPLDYGIGDEPEHSMLLRRHRIALFRNRQEAIDAIEDTVSRSKAAGHAWVKRFTSFPIVEVRRAHQ